MLLNPASQTVGHEATPAEELLTLPLGHVLHMDSALAASAALYLPTPQATQWFTFTRAAALPYFPGAHCTHPAAPVLLHAPVSHDAQVGSPVFAKVPAAHGKHPL